LDITGLITRIVVAVISIDAGRKGFSIEGKEREGRVSFEKGIASALAAFKEAQIINSFYIIKITALKASQKMLFIMPVFS